MGAHVVLRSPVSLLLLWNVGGALLEEQGMYLSLFPSKHMMFSIHKYGPT